MATTVLDHRNSRFKAPLEGWYLVKYQRNDEYNPVELKVQVTISTLSSVIVVIPEQENLDHVVTTEYPLRSDHSSDTMSKKQMEMAKDELIRRMDILIGKSLD